MVFHGFKDTDLIPELQEWKNHNGDITLTFWAEPKNKTE